MATTPGTAKTILRNLAHLEPPVKGSKFAFKNVPTIFRHQPAFVQPKNRIAFWNIVPGDIVRVRTGKVAERSLEGENAEGSSSSGAGAASPLDSRRSRKIRGEGKVVSIDRTRNLVWLRDIDEESETAPKLAPRALKHVVPRLVDPEAGEEKGYSPNVMDVPRPVHYSNLSLRLPDEVVSKEELKAAPGNSLFAQKLTRSKAIYDNKKGMYLWRRFATYRNPTTGAYERVEIPWPKMPERRRTRTAEHADLSVVQQESWIPWRPEDPVFLPPEFETRLGRQRSTIEGELKAQEQLALRDPIDEALLAETKQPGGAMLSKREKSKLTRAPPIAQAPTPSETIGLSARSLAAWSQDPDVQEHVQEYGGRAFSASDYLDLAPSFGPVSGGDWSGLAQSPEPGATVLDGELRDRATGKLLSKPSQDQVDSFPIELLMKRDLVNDNSRARRQKRHIEKTNEKNIEKLIEQRMEKENLAALRKLEL